MTVWTYTYIYMHVYMCVLIHSRVDASLHAGAHVCINTLIDLAMASTDVWLHHRTPVPLLELNLASRLRPKQLPMNFCWML